MSEMDVWRAAAAQLVGNIDETQVEDSPPQVARVASVPQIAEEQNEEDPFSDLPEIAPVSQDVLDELGDDDEDDTQTPTTPSYVTDEEDDEYVDDATRKLRSELRATQKQLANERRQRSEQNVVNWRERYKRMYPLADVEGITATSRRAFERQAILSHNKNYNVLKPHIEAFKTAREEIRNETSTNERANVQAAWGKPTTGPGSSDHRSADREAAYEKSRKESKSLQSHFRNMLAIEDESRGRR